jgi:hypothetical protein
LVEQVVFAVMEDDAVWVVEPTLSGCEVKGWSPILCVAHGLAPLDCELERAWKVGLSRVT